MARVTSGEGSQRAGTGVLRSLVRWVMVKGPASVYAAGERGGGSMPWPVLGALVGVVSVCAGVAAFTAVLLRRDVAEWADTGLLVGVFFFFAWTVYALAALAVMWFRGVSPSLILDGDSSPGPIAEPRGGRHVAEVSWRSRGDRLIPGSAVAFFALMVVFGVGEWALNLRADGYVSAANRSVTTGQVLEFRDPHFWDKGPGAIVVSFDAGSPVTVEVSGEIGEHDTDIGDPVPIKYDRSDPSRAQIAWTREARADNRVFGQWFTGIAAALTLITGTAWLIAHLRNQK